MSIIKTPVEKELADYYVQYAVQTAGRGIPSVVDGLKAIQRRIIQGAFDQSLKSSGPFKKVSRLDGGVLGNYSPHGSSAGAIINIGNPSDYLQPYLRIHGNQGGVSTESRQKISNDAPAAARYLECKMTSFTEAVFDIEKKYLKTRPNYDGSLQEIVEYVPALPLALVNPQQGIAVGWATNTVGFPVKNVIKAITQVGNNTKVAAALGSPDIPYSTNIVQNEALTELQETGKASIDLIGSWVIDKKYKYKTRSTREAIIVTKIAFGNAEQFIDRLKSALENDKIDGVADVIDETSKEIRVVIVLKSGIKADNVLSLIVRHTSLSHKFPAKLTLIEGILPKEFAPYQILNIWYQARTNVLLNKYGKELEIVNDRLLIVDGLLNVFNRLKEIAILIMDSDSPDQAKSRIINKYEVLDVVADAILEIQLKKLTKMSRLSLEKEKSELEQLRDELNGLLTDKNLLHKQIIKLAKNVGKHCCDRISPIIKPPKFKKIKTVSAKTKQLSAFEKAIQKTVFRCPNGKMSPPITRRAFNKGVRDGKSSTTIINEHNTKWKTKNKKATTSKSKKRTRNQK